MEKENKFFWWFFSLTTRFFFCRLKIWMVGKCMHSNLVDLEKKLVRNEFRRRHCQCSWKGSLMFLLQIILTSTLQNTHFTTRLDEYLFVRITKDERLLSKIYLPLYKYRNLIPFLADLRLPNHTYGTKSGHTEGQFNTIYCTLDMKYKVSNWYPSWV